MKLISTSCVDRASFIYYESIDSFFCTHCKQKMYDNNIKINRGNGRAAEITCECGQYYNECDKNGETIGSTAYGSKEEMSLASETVFRNTDKGRDQIVLSKIFESFFPVKTKKNVQLIKRRTRFERIILNLKTGQSYSVGRNDDHPINITYMSHVWQMHTSNPEIRRIIVEELLKAKGVNPAMHLTQTGIDNVYDFVTLINRMPNMFIRRNSILNIDTLRANYENIISMPKELLKQMPYDIKHEDDFIDCIKKSFKITHPIMLNALQTDPSTLSTSVILKDMKITNDVLVTDILKQVGVGDYNLMVNIRDNTFQYCDKKQFKSYMTALKKEIPDDDKRYKHIAKIIQTSPIHGGPGYVLAMLINDWHNNNRDEKILLYGTTVVSDPQEEDLPFN